MNLPRYQFSKEVEPELLQFLKVARTHKSQNKRCDLNSYEVWKKIMPPDPTLIEKLDQDEDNKIPIIDLCSDEEFEIVSVKNKEDEIEQVLNDKVSMSDMVCVIKENIETQNVLSDATKEYLSKCADTDLEMLFEMLEGDLTTEEIYYLGVSLQSVVSNVLIVLFCRRILIPKLKKEFCDRISTLLDQLTIKYSSVIIDQSCSTLKEISSGEVNVFLQYIKKLDLQFRSTLVRNFILSVDRLDENSLIIVETLLDNEIEYEALSKFVHMLSTIAEDHTKDKNFGKLLMNVVEALGANLMHLEQPLRHIIAGHKSVWKDKLEKTFSTCYEDSMMFTQSFRE